MAIEMGTATVAVTSEERTWRVNIETPKGGDPVVTVWREVVKSAADGSIISKEQNAVATRSLSAVVTEMQPFTPATSGQISAAELASLIAGRADMWRTQDMATPAP